MSILSHLCKIRNISVFILTQLGKYSESYLCMVTATDLPSVLCTLDISYDHYAEV